MSAFLHLRDRLTHFWQLSGTMANSDLKLGPNCLGSLDATVAMTKPTFLSKTRKVVAWFAGIVQFGFVNRVEATYVNRASPFCILISTFPKQIRSVSIALVLFTYLGNTK
jgi:hypothetical protein